jgi:hypothetical protein
MLLLRPVRRLVVLALMIAVALVAIPALIPELNPFKSEQVDRSPPAVLRSLARLSEYRAATANLQQIVDVEEDTILPGFLAGERTLIQASGTVDAAVDFRGLQAGRDLQVSEDRRSVTVTLPAPRLTAPRLNLAETRVVDRDRGLGNRIADVFGDDADEERELLALAERRLAEAAAADPALLRAGERNTREMLTGLLRGLGFERVTVRFAPPTV